ncbi:Lachesin [Frankliniella fusca]|uniref:Lachesin n=1 Tax=Frankliniella fusca TaxID=407009 RepID=A0AAE1HWS9_9NEOP|nr:Lachesin [Frankliniella fusca]
MRRAARRCREKKQRDDRAELHYTPNATQMHLNIKNLAVVDEATYKCEITYNEVKDGCAVVQFINLTTMSK